MWGNHATPVLSVPINLSSTNLENNGSVRNPHFLIVPRHVAVPPSRSDKDRGSEARTAGALYQQAGHVMTRQLAFLAASQLKNGQKRKYQ